MADPLEELKADVQNLKTDRKVEEARTEAIANSQKVLQEWMANHERRSNDELGQRKEYLKQLQESTQSELNTKLDTVKRDIDNQVDKIRERISTASALGFISIAVPTVLSVALWFNMSGWASGVKKDAKDEIDRVVNENLIKSVAVEDAKNRLVGDLQLSFANQTLFEVTSSLSRITRTLRDGLHRSYDHRHSKAMATRFEIIALDAIALQLAYTNAYQQTKVSPERQRALLLLVSGLDALAQGDGNRARQLYELADREDPSFPEVPLFKARINVDGLTYLGLGRWDATSQEREQYLALLESAKERSKDEMKDKGLRHPFNTDFDSIDSMIVRARITPENWKTQEITLVDTINAEAKRNPKDPRIRLRRGRYNWELLRSREIAPTKNKSIRDAALDGYSEAVKLDPDLLFAINNYLWARTHWSDVQGNRDDVHSNLDEAPIQLSEDEKNGIRSDRFVREILEDYQSRSEVLHDPSSLNTIAEYYFAVGDAKQGQAYAGLSIVEAAHHLVPGCSTTELSARYEYYFGASGRTRPGLFNAETAAVLADGLLASIVANR